MGTRHLNSGGVPTTHTLTSRSVTLCHSPITVDFSRYRCFSIQSMCEWDGESRRKCPNVSTRGLHDLDTTMPVSDCKQEIFMKLDVQILREINFL